jgi:hypothetical protein
MDRQRDMRHIEVYIKFGRKECLKGKALMRGMGLKTDKLVVVSKYVWRRAKDLLFLLVGLAPSIPNL